MEDRFYIFTVFSHCPVPKLTTCSQLKGSGAQPKPNCAGLKPLVGNIGPFVSQIKEMQWFQAKEVFFIKIGALSLKIR